MAFTMPAGAYVDYKFDGDLTDNSGNARTALLTGLQSDPTYAATNEDQAIQISRHTKRPEYADGGDIWSSGLRSLFMFARMRPVTKPTGNGPFFYVGDSSPQFGVNIELAAGGNDFDAHLVVETDGGQLELVASLVGVFNGATPQWVSFVAEWLHDPGSSVANIWVYGENGGSDWTNDEPADDMLDSSEENIVIGPDTNATFGTHENWQIDRFGLWLDRVSTAGERSGLAQFPTSYDRRQALRRLCP